jgi:serine/threonine protein kinase/Flp pilus assembly protein TadD
MALPAGTHLGSYEILASLGAGGMGEVYRARDTRLDREVALKVLPDAVAGDPERLGRFEREARTVAGLNHPNIVVLHSIEVDRGVHFITMELVDGERLDRSVRAGGLPVSRLFDISIQLADALAAAHEKGVVHRDLKPANVMVTREGRVKVLDFGLAKPVRADAATAGSLAATAESPISQAGQVMGTVPYMAPEQVRGDAVDARTDLFAFGIILYELATGRRPFQGRTSADIGSAILRDPPEPLVSTRADLPGELEQAVLRCLRKAPADRFQSARELRTELARLRRALEQGDAAAAPEGPSIAVLPFSNMSADPENEYFSDGLSEELLNVLAKIPELKVTGRTSSFAFKGRQEDLRVIGQKLGVGTLLEGSVRKAGNRVRITAQLIKAADGFHLWSETYDRVLDDIFAVQDDIARSVSTALHVTLLGKRATASRTSGESYQLVLRANHALRRNTGPATDTAIGLYREAIGENAEDAAAWAGLGRAYAYQAFYGYAEVEASRRQAKDAVARALELDDRLSEAHEVMGMILASLEFRWKEALESVRRARALAPGAASPMTAMATYEAATGSMEEGLRLVRTAQEIDPLDPAVHWCRGRIESSLSNLEAASDAYRRTLELSPGATGVHAQLGILYLRRGMTTEALEEIRREPSDGYRDCSLAIGYHALGRKAESDEALARLLALSEQWGFQFAVAHACRGEVDEAFRWLDRSYELHDSGIMGVKVAWGLENLYADPRWPELLRKIGLAD